jgi:hypothetical protein
VCSNILIILLGAVLGFAFPDRWLLSGFAEAVAPVFWVALDRWRHRARTH